MHYPLIFNQGNFSVQAHLLFETLAFFIGYRYFVYLRKTKHDLIPENNRIWIIIAAAFGAFLFSRLIGSLEDPNQFAHSSSPLLYFYANKTIVGGLLGALLVVELTKIKLKEKSSSGDLFTYPLILAMMIGRVGCFTAGVSEPTYGIESSLPWAMDLGDGVMRHPVALYEIVFLALLWVSIVEVEKNVELINGLRFKVFMICYLIFRLLIDFIKPAHFFSIGVTTIQLACLAGLAYYSKTLYLFLVKPSKLIAHES
jgi:prolipoprotein diacylglyceryltransferase